MKVILAVAMFATLQAAAPVTLTTLRGITLQWDPVAGCTYRVTVNGVVHATQDTRILLTEGIGDTNTATVTAIRGGMESVPSTPLVFTGETYFRAEGSGLQWSEDLQTWTDVGSPFFTNRKRGFFREGD